MSAEGRMSLRGRGRTDRARACLTRRPRCDGEEPVWVVMPRIESGLGRSLKRTYQHRAVCMSSGLFLAEGRSGGGVVCVKALLLQKEP